MAVEQSSINLGEVRELLRDLASAWAQEWLSIWREVRERFWAAETGLTTVVFGTSELMVRQPDSKVERTIPLDEEIGAVSLITVLRREASPSKYIVAAFPEHEVLRPTVHLPKASLSVLRKALHFELARVSPIPPDQLYFDFTLQPSEASRSEVDVFVRLVRRAVVDGAAAITHGAGLEIAAIRLGNDERPADWQAFPVDRKAFLVSHWQRWRIAILAALAVLLGVFFVVAMYARGEASESDLTHQVDTARVRAAAVERLQGQLQAIGREQSFLALEKQKPLLVATLAELSAALPDDTWLTDLQATGKKFRIQGYSRSASHLVSRLAQSGRFSNPEFQSPLMQDSTTHAERFDLSFEVAR